MISAVLIAQDLLDYLERRGEVDARVQAVYRTAINLQLDTDQLVTIVDETHAGIPMGVVINDAVSAARLSIGDTLILSAKGFKTAAGDDLADFNGCQTWQPGAVPDAELRDASQVQGLRNDIFNWLSTFEPIGLLPLINYQGAHSKDDRFEISDTYCRFIARDLLDFSERLISGNLPQALKVSKKLIGFGMGSTPSCDDYLAAVLLILARWQSANPLNSAEVEEFSSQLIALADVNTTLVSANMLRLASSGRSSQVHEALINALLYKTESDITYLMSQVIKTGASSGADFMAGLLCGLDWYIAQQSLQPIERCLEQAMSVAFVRKGCDDNSNNC